MNYNPLFKSLVLCTTISILVINTVLGLFQLLIRISFPFLLAKDLRRVLLILITRNVYSPIRRGYIRKVIVHLVQKYFHIIAVLIVFLAANGKK